MGTTLNYAMFGTAAGACAGALAAGMQKPPPGMTWQSFLMRDVTRHTAMFGGIAAIFGVTQSTLNTVRGHSTANDVAAGCIAGSLVGARSGSFERAGLGCAFFGGMQFVGACARRARASPAPRRAAPPIR